jgi:hypothetical protein
MELQIVKEWIVLLSHVRHLYIEMVKGMSKQLLTGETTHALLDSLIGV